MSLLTIIQNVSLIVGLPAPSTVTANDDLQAQQMIKLVNRAGESLARRYEWSALNKEANFTTVAAELQGALSTIAPGFRFMIDETIWNRTEQNRVGGPLSPQGWQLLKAQVALGPYSNYRIRDGSLYFLPVPTAGQDAYFEYRSAYWAETSGGTEKATMTLDDDVSVLDEYLLELGTHWRFLQVNSLDYGEVYREYEKEANNAMAKDGGKPRLNIQSAGLIDYHPMVPEGNWNL